MSGDGPTPAAPPGAGDPGAAAPPPPPPPPPAGYPPYAPPSYSWAPGGGKRRRPAWQLAAGILALGIIVGVAVAVPLTVLRSSGGSGSPSPAAGSGTSSQAIAVYRQALAAMRSSRGFHYDAVVSGAGGQRTVGDAGSGDGRQDITVTASYGAEHFTLLLVNGTVYFQGNVPAFEDQLGVPASKASALGNSWISVSKGDGPYAILEVGITASDQADETALEPASYSQVTLAGGTSALRLQGAVPPQQGAPAGTGHLDVASSDHHPLSYVANISDGTTTVSSTVTFSAWGTAPSVNAPSGATAWSTLGASPPPGGYGSGGAPGSSPTPQPAF